MTKIFGLDRATPSQAVSEEGDQMSFSETTDGQQSSF